MSQTSYEMLYERWNGAVAECDALRAENERLNVLLMNTRGERADLRAEVERLGNQWIIKPTYDAVYDERDTLREEVDRLRALLREHLIEEPQPRSGEEQR